MVVETITETGVQAGTLLQQTAVSLWNSFITIFPGIIAAILLIAIGWIVGKAIGFAFQEILKRAKLDYWIKKENLSGAIWGKNLSEILGSLLKWYIVVVFLGAAAAVVQLEPLVKFADYLVLYLPALFGAVLVVLIGLLAGEYLKRLVIGTKMAYNEVIGSIIKFLAIYFTLVIGLQTAGFDVTILVDAFRIGFAAFAVTVAIILGIGFGAAFKEDARRILKKFEKSTKK